MRRFALPLPLAAVLAAPAHGATLSRLDGIGLGPGLASSGPYAHHLSVFALFLTGPPGAGKTSVLAALSDALSDADVRHAALEVEALRCTHPPPSLEEEMRQLHSVCGLFRQGGHQVLVIARTIEDDAEMAAMLRAIDPDDHLVVRLEAHSTTLVSRILAREPPSWSGLKNLVAHAQELAASMPGLSGVGLVISTESELAEDVADRIIARCPDQLGWTDRP